MRSHLVAALIVLAVAPTATAAALRVEQNGTGDFVVIQDAVNAAADGDTILIGPGRYDDLRPRGPLNTVCVAWWNDLRSLTFIGVHRDSVIVGPTSYIPEGSGPQGLHQYTGGGLVVRSMTFENLKFGVVSGGTGSMEFENLRIAAGNAGLDVLAPASCTVRNSSFVSGFPGSEQIHYGVLAFSPDDIAVTNCSFEDARIYVDHCPRALVSDCTVENGVFVKFWDVNGTIRRSVAHCSDKAFGIAVSDGDTVRIEDTVVEGGWRNVSADGTAGHTVLIIERCAFRDPTWTTNFDFGFNITVEAHNNDIRAGAGVPYIVTTWGYSETLGNYIDMGNNYWGEHSSAAALDSLIYDDNDDPSINVIVNYEPIRTEPTPMRRASLGGLKALFLGR